MNNTASAVELVPLTDLRDFPDNPKDELGAQYDKALKTSIKTFKFSGSLVLTPRLDLDAVPELAGYYGADNKYMMADGNKRLERLGALGYRWVLVFPQPTEDDGDATATVIERIVGAGPELLRQLRKVKQGEMIAQGRVNPRLTTPEALKKFVLAYDRGRARYNEGMVQSTIDELIAKGEPVDLIMDLAAVKQAAMRSVLETSARDDDENSSGEPRDLAKLVADRKKAREDALRFPVGPFFLTKDALEHYERLTEKVKALAQGGREGRLLGILAKAVEAGAEEDVLMEAAIERAWAAWQRENGSGGS